MKSETIFPMLERKARGRCERVYDFFHTQVCGSALLGGKSVMCQRQRRNEENDASRIFHLYVSGGGSAVTALLPAKCDFAEKKA